jgi:DNA-binding NarL/FixJ family response regulator
MPGESGLDVLRDLKRADPRIKVLILSMNPEGRVAIRALKNGASGYITKESARDELITAIRQMYDGRTLKEISPELYLSLSTVSTYRARVLAKMNMHSNADIIHYAIKNNLVD